MEGGSDPPWTMGGCKGHEEGKAAVTNRGLGLPSDMRESYVSGTRCVLPGVAGGVS